MNPILSIISIKIKGDKEAKTNYNGTRSIKQKTIFSKDTNKE